jgi:hypothetical protein
MQILENVEEVKSILEGKWFVTMKEADSLCLSDNERRAGVNRRI